jgi:hypothetical protein
VSTLGVLGLWFSVLRQLLSVVSEGRKLKTENHTARTAAVFFFASLLQDASDFGGVMNNGKVNGSIGNDRN